MTDPGPDYLADQIYTGLRMTLGDSAVVDYPCKQIYHDPSKKLWYLPQSPGSDHRQQDVLGLLGEKYFDFICVSSPRMGPQKSLESLRKASHLPPLVFLDGEDDARIRYELAERYSVALYFKREYIWGGGKRVRRFKDYYNYLRSFHYNKGLFQSTYPLPFSAIVQEIPKVRASDRDIDVSFRGFAWSKDSRKRHKAYGILKGMEGCRFVGGIYTPKDPSSRVGHDEYYGELRRSKISVSIRGGGFDTLRFWEIPACKALLISERPDISIPHCFEHERHAVFCKEELSDLMELVRYYLSHEEERDRIASQGYEHLMKYHTCERRADYLLDICKNRL